MRFALFISDIIVKIFALTLFSSISLFAVDRETAPGSRTVFVSSMNGETIRLKFRNCLCADPKDCKCCENLVDDQPASQGCARIFSYLCNQLFNINEHPLQKGSKGVIEYLTIKNFLTRLEKTGFRQYFEVIENGNLVSPKDFLRLITSGKIPVADFDPDHADFMQFHNMIHDLNNHIPFWLLLEDSIRNMAVSRYQYFFSKLELIKKEELDDPLTVLFCDIILSWSSLAIDTSMGSLNNLFFQDAAHDSPPDFKDDTLLARIGKQFSIFFNLIEYIDKDREHWIEMNKAVWLRDILPIMALDIAQNPKYWQNQEFCDDESFKKFILCSESERLKAVEDFKEIVNKYISDGDSDFAKMNTVRIVEMFIQEISKRTEIIKNAQPSTFS